MSAETVWFLKNSRIANVAGALSTAGVWNTTWQFDGIPCGGAIPGNIMSAPDNTTAGGANQTNPAFGEKKWLADLMAMDKQGDRHHILYDRLLHVGGLDASSTAEQFFDPVGQGYVPVTRYTEGTGNTIWLEVNQTIGPSAVGVSITYLNQDGSPAIATTTITVSNNVPGIALPTALALGDNGVQAVKSITLSGSTGAVGNLGVVVSRELVKFAAPRPALYSGPYQGFIEIKSNACLSWFTRSIGGTSLAFPHIIGCLLFIDK